jgi:hypothetical protein
LSNRGRLARMSLAPTALATRCTERAGRRVR